jgi:hypothetical protein
VQELQFQDFVCRYSGTGQLHFEDHRSLECTFEATQHQNGGLRLRCELPNSSKRTDGIRLFEDIPNRLTGMTNDGRKLNFSGPFVNVFHSYSSRTDIRRVAYVAHGRSRLRLGTFPTKGQVTMRFAVCNFQFFGTIPEHFERDNREGDRMSILPINIEGQEISFQQVSNCDEVIEQLKIHGGARITCLAHVKVTKPDDRESILSQFDNLCWILSLARCNLVTWLYFDVVRGDGTVSYSEHRPTITRSFVSDYLVDWLPPLTTVDFVESAFPRYADLAPVYELNKVVPLYLDIRSNQVFLETRALMLVALLDYLCNRFFKVSDDHESTIVNEEVFKESLDGLEERVRETLQDIFPHLSLDKIDKMVGNIRGLNYPTFRYQLREICKYFDVPTNSRERNRVVETRNKLVHYSTFCTSDPSREYRKLLHLLDKLLLRMVGYRGEYVNAVTFKNVSLVG